MMKKTLYASLAICAIIAIPLTAGAEKSSERNYGVTDPKPIPAEEKAHPYKMDLSKLPSPKVDHEKDKQVAEKHHGEFYSEHFTAPKPISEETYPTVSESSQDNQTEMVITPDFYTSLNWSYSSLDAGTYIDTRESYKLSGTQDVPVKLVQYPAPFTSGYVTMGYKLVSVTCCGTTTSEIRINGSYTSTATSFSFVNVPTGTYQLRIYNRSSIQTSGNGYVFWW